MADILGEAKEAIDRKRNPRGQLRPQDGRGGGKGMPGGQRGNKNTEPCPEGGPGYGGGAGRGKGKNRKEQ